MTDVVNHPPHYTSHPSGVECITVVEHMSFNLGNAIKYLWRADEKGSPLEDLRKAAWYVNREIQRREKANDAAPTERHEDPDWRSCCESKTGDFHLLACPTRATTS